jgi:hypothetical protein
VERADEVVDHGGVVWVRYRAVSRIRVRHRSRS